MFKSTIALLVLAFVAPYIYDRWLVLSQTILSNGPSQLVRANNFKEHGVKLQNLVRNCEDALLDEGMGLAVLSCDEGRDKWNTVMGFFHQQGVPNGGLYIYDYANPDLSEEKAIKQIQFLDFPAAETDFHPLGIELDATTSTLYVVDHAKSGPFIHVFELSVRSASAKLIRTITHPLVHAPNSITSLGDGKILFTNDHWMKAGRSDIGSKIETFSGFPGGSVVYMDVHRPGTAKKLTNVPFANGITMLNESTVVVASSSKTGISLYHLTPTRDLIFRRFVRVPAAVDNLSTDGNGKILVAGHAYAPGIMMVAANRARCNHGTAEERAKEACKIRSPSYVAEWSEEEGLKQLYLDDAFESSTTAVRDTTRGIGLVAGLYEKGILVWKD